MGEAALCILVPIRASQAAIHSFLGHFEAPSPSLKGLQIHLLDSNPSDREEELAHIPQIAYHHLPGTGLYEALMEGVSACPSDAWVMVLGLDDRITNPVPWATLAQAGRAGASAVLFDVTLELHRSGRRKVYRTRVPQGFGAADFLTFPFHHQGFLARAGLLKEKFPFRPRLGLAADYGQMIEIAQAEPLVKAEGEPWVTFRTGGLSDYGRFSWLGSLIKVARASGLGVWGILGAHPMVALKLLLKAFVPRLVIAWLR